MAAGKDKKGQDKGEEAEESSPALPYLQLFRYADTLDYVYLFFGTVGAVVNGSALPVFFYFLSGLLDSFGKYAGDDPAKAADRVTKYVLDFVYVSLVAFGGAYAEVSFWMQTGERQSARVRSLYLRAILRQDVGYFDTVASTGDVVSRVSSDTLLFQDAIGEKVGNFIHNVSTFVAGFIVAFVQVWQITLLMAAFIPVLAIPGILYAKVLTGLTAKESAAYSEAGSIAEQAISSVRTVYSFVGESKTLDNYSAALTKSFKTGLKQGMAKGMALGANGLMFCLWSLMFWFGGKLVINGDATGGKVLGTAFSVIIGGLALGQAMPNLKAFSKGRIAGYRIFEMIDRIPPIDSDDPNGQILPKVVGDIELKNVSFTYPARPDVPIFTDFSLRIPSGKTVALVGSSGSGKSTVISLIERFYDPLRGEVLIDGVNIKSLQLKWLRLQIGLVSQEPALFATSIKENIKYGKEGATDEEIEAAAKAANAYKFISDLPDKFDTRVGERGVQMSGGQKQRIAIARAILKNPPILLLDEATSALDAESERIVQEALDNASVGRTTVVVAHRLSTIRNADIIAVVHKGSVVETGSHDELISNPNGAYTSLVNLQNKRPDEGEKNQTEKDQESHNVKKSIDKRVSLQLSSLSGLSDGHVSEKGGDEKAPPQPSFFRLLYLNKPEWKEALLGTLGGILVGLVNPFWAFVVAYVIGVYFNPSHHYIRQETTKYALIFLGFGLYSFVVNILLHYFYGAMGEHLTKRVREMMLSKMLQQEVGWFDSEENSSGVLTSKLSTDATLVRALVGDRMSLLVQTFSSVGVTIILGLALQWKLALVMLSTLPLMMFSFLIQNWMLKGFSAETAKAQEQASQVAAEAVSQHRTVTAFSSQDKVLGLFDSKLEGPQKLSWVRSQTAGVGLGFSQFILFNSWGLALWYGSQLAKNEGVSFTNVFKVFLVVISVGFGLAEAASLAPDFARGGQAVASVFGILDRETQIDADSEEGEEPEKIVGSIDVRNVKFAYPSRPDVIVFDDFSIKVPAGTTTAFVGQSGSGKSTIIGLIERFYDPLHGRIFIDGKDIKKYRLKALRRFIGLVQQEPVLFATSIYENITYGLDKVSEAEVENAAKAANAHTFISGLPDGYQTYCGERGVQLSGGQKQRIAIARAVLKNPAILLLDEATSALDAESEKVVQDALDKIMVGRTTIVVAHRLSTIRNADSIAVLQKGKLVELGSHDTLMQKGEEGAYYSLVKLQMHTS